MKIKKFLAACIGLVFVLNSTVFASELGSELVTHKVINIGEGANLITNSFFSDQSGVGLQTENYVEYSPNSTLVPQVINDAYLYGKITTSSMANSLLTNGRYPTMLMNSDFFSFQTGVPMSNQVEDGVLVTKSTDQTDAIGINGDGTAFISWFGIDLTIKVKDQVLSIDNFNKYRQPYVIYMFDDRFGTTTKASDPGLNVVLGSVSGNLTMDSQITAKVESVTEDNGEAEIPKGKIVLSADMRVPEEVMNQLKLFEVGDEVTINTSALGDSRWTNAKYILGCLGGRIVKDGKITSADEAAAPRSAFGIKADGSLIFYTIDGRQSGHSYGVRLRTLANRMVELGCVDAVNLDGGGSTTIGAIYPGSDSFSVTNKPSDGSQRQVATFIGLVNTASPSYQASKLFVYPYGKNYLSGATETFSVQATDSAYYKSNVPDSITYIAPDGTESTDGKVKISGNGVVTVTAKSQSGITGTAMVNCYQTPTSITVANRPTGSAVNSLNIGVLEKINLKASASVGHKALISDDGCYEWQCSPEIGTIDQSGNFVASDKNANGEITVSAGGFTKKIPVTVGATDDCYTDINFEDTAPGQVQISLLNTRGVGITQDGISLYVDGQKTAFSLTDNKINVVFDDIFYHKIKVVATNNSSLCSVGYHTSAGAGYKNNFDDMETSWAKNYVSYMNNLGIVNGFNENGKSTFKPADNVTRAQFAVMVANMLGADTSAYSSKPLGFDDASSVPSWAANHIKYLAEQNIMQGKQNGGSTVFDSNANLTRAEAMTVLSRLLNYNIQAKKSSFADYGDIPSWAKGGFDKLYSLGIISGYEDNSVRPLNNITRAEAIKLLYEVY